MFGIDPIVVLKADKEEWLMRIAAAMVIQADKRAQAKRNNEKKL